MGIPQTHHQTTPANPQYQHTRNIDIIFSNMNSITTDHTLRDVPVYFPDGMARLSRHGWLVLHRDGSHALRWLPVHIPKGTWHNFPDHNQCITTKPNYQTRIQCTLGSPTQCHIQGGPKTGLFLRSHNFATTNDRKACNTSKVSEYCLE